MTLVCWQEGRALFLVTISIVLFTVRPSLLLWSSKRVSNFSPSLIHLLHVSVRQSCARHVSNICGRRVVGMGYICAVDMVDVCERQTLDVHQAVARPALGMQEAGGRQALDVH